MVFNIQVELETSDKTFQEIAEQYNVSQQFVEVVYKEILKQETSL